MTDKLERPDPEQRALDAGIDAVRAAMYAYKSSFPDLPPGAATRIVQMVAAALASSSVPEQWQPIETAPKDETGRFLIAHFTARRLDWVNDATWHALKRCWGRWDGERLTHSFIPTHWMPLPPPPAPQDRGASQEDDLTRQALEQGSAE